MRETLPGGKRGDSSSAGETDWAAGAGRLGQERTRGRSGPSARWGRYRVTDALALPELAIHRGPDRTARLLAPTLGKSRFVYLTRGLDRESLPEPYEKDNEGEDGQPAYGIAKEPERLILLCVEIQENRPAKHK